MLYGYRTGPPGWESIPGLLKRSTNTGSVQMFTLGGVGEVKEKAEGQKFTRGVEITNTTDCISSL
jgi:hypothetical protein